MACMLGLACVAALDLPVVLAPALAALATLAASPYPPCVAATTPRLVPAEVLPGANAARVAVASLCIVAGPGFGALLLLLGSPTAAFVVNAGTFALSAVLVLSLPHGDLFTPVRSEGPAEGVFEELGAAVSALRDQPEAVRLVGADVVASAVGGAHTVLLLLLAHRVGVGDAGYGYLLAALGAGGVVGTLVAGRVGGTDRPRTLLVAACTVVAGPAMLMAVTPSMPLLLLWAALVGAGSIVIEVAADTSLQKCLSPDVLARAYGITFPAAILGIVVGSLVASPLVLTLGLQGALVAVGAAMAGYGVLLAGLGRRPRRRTPETAGVGAAPAHA
jgi:predicted MFS family arabinose efflux permease